MNLDCADNPNEIAFYTNYFDEIWQENMMKLKVQSSLEVARTFSDYYVA